jgi:hypothetical protein
LPVIQPHETYCFLLGTNYAGEVDELEQALTSVQLKPTGRLRVNAPVSFGILHVAPAIPPFLDQYPGIEIDLTLNDRFIDHLVRHFEQPEWTGRPPV